MASNLFLKGTAARDFLPSNPIKFSTFILLLQIGLQGISLPLFLKLTAARDFFPSYPIKFSTFIILLSLFFQGWRRISIFKGQQQEIFYHPILSSP
jgi:hypothetical protein